MSSGGFRAVSPAERRAQLRQTPYCIWFTGLSGAGKTTLGQLLDHDLASRGFHTFMIDGDHVRGALCRDLSFSEADRIENARRVGAVARMMVDAGLIVIVTLISPLRAAREAARAQFDDGSFVEVFVDAPVEVCERRDVKGLYQRARAGSIANFTGVSAGYERPEAPDVHVETAVRSADVCLAFIVAELERRGLMTRLDA